VCSSSSRPPSRHECGLADYGETVRKRSAHLAAFVPFEHMPGNSANPEDTSVWKSLPATPASK